MSELKNYELNDDELDEVLGGLGLPPDVNRTAVREALGVIFMGDEADSATIRERIGVIFAGCGLRMGETDIYRFITDARELKIRGAFMAPMKYRTPGMLGKEE